MSFWFGEAPVDGICVCCGEVTAGGALHGVCGLGAGAAGVGGVGVTAVGSLAAWVEGADVDTAGVTLPVLDVSGFDSIWMMFLNVVMSMFVLSTTNDLDQV